MKGLLLLAFGILLSGDLAIAKAGTCPALFSPSDKVVSARETELKAIIRDGVSTEIEVKIPSGLQSFQIEVWGRDDQVYLVENLVDPKETDLGSFRPGVAPGFVSRLVQDPKKTQLLKGQYRFRVRSVSETKPSHEVTVRIVHKPKIKSTLSSQLRVKMFVPSTLGLDPTSDTYRRMISHLSRTFATLKIDLKIDFLALDSSLSSVIDEPSLTSLFAFDSGQPDPGALKFYFIKELAFAETSYVAGYSFGVPGPSSQAGLQHAGAIMTADWFPRPEDSVETQQGFAEQTANVITHEILHYLGLAHTYELHGSLQEDAHADTAADDWMNAMSPHPPRGGIPRLSPSQLREFLAHPLLR